MNQSIQARNKAMVLEAFDTLFNKRDISSIPFFNAASSEIPGFAAYFRTSL